MSDSGANQAMCCEGELLSSEAGRCADGGRSSSEPVLLSISLSRKLVFSVTSGWLAEIWFTNAPLAWVIVFVVVAARPPELLPPAFLRRCSRWIRTDVGEGTRRPEDVEAAAAAELGDGPPPAMANTFRADGQWHSG